MKVTIVRADGVVGVDGIFLPVDLASIPENVRVIQWDGGAGHIEWIGTENSLIESITAYQPVIDAWQAAKDVLDAKAADPYYGMTADEIKNSKSAAIRKKYADMLIAIAQPYGPEERETWKTQEEEALQWQVNDTAPCPMIRAMATTRGISMALMVEKIMENSGLFRYASGQILGTQQRELDELWAVI